MSLILLIAVSLMVCAPFAGAQAGDAYSYGWMDDIRKEHPRLFFSGDEIERIRLHALSEEREAYEKMKSRVDAAMAKPIEFVNLLQPDGGENSNHRYGFTASESAVLWLLSAEEKYLDYAKELIVRLSDYYCFRNEHNLNIQWYSFSQICTLCAFDWIYNALKEEERTEIGRGLFKAVNGIAWDGTRKVRFRENASDYKSGCYGTSILPWYLGLVFHAEGVDDARADSLLKIGYELHMKMSGFRREMCGTNGGGATACMEYTFRFYPYAEFNFLRTFRSATGIDLSEDWNYILGYLNYMDWNRLPGNLEYGFGDVRHYSCKLPEEDMNYHLCELVDLFGERHPEILPKARRLLTHFTKRKKAEEFAFVRFLHRPAGEGDMMWEDEGDKRHAVFFEQMGQVFMRSGVGDNDTYAMFTSGGIPLQHKHFDNNNFVIYRNGYRALDSGTRPQPGLHLSHYFARTVAHNCITVRMPGERMPKYWGSAALCENADEPVPNDGGQCDERASELLDFRECDDFVYLASDATKAYSPEKVSLVVREFVYLMPDVFVVFDRVTSTDRDYRKRWLLHTVSEPVLHSPNEFSESSYGGRLICRTILPAKSELVTVGGPGKQFWSDGKNWSLPELTPEDWNYALRKMTPPDSHPLLGQWRVEVSPAKAAEKDFFLHLIQVGDKDLEALPATKRIRERGRVGVAFDYGDKSFRILFDTGEKYGCEVYVNEVLIK